MSPAKHVFDFFTLVGVHLQKTADALARLLGRVENVGTGIQAAGVNAEERQLPDKRIGHDLENQSRERLFVVRLPDFGSRSIRSQTLNRRDIHRRRQITHNGIEQLLNAFVLERRTTEDRRQLDGDRSLADRSLQLFIRDRFTAEQTSRRASRRLRMPLR